MDAYSMQEGETIHGVVTGKPPVVGGSKGRAGAPGRSVAIVVREVLEYDDRDLADASVVVQGYGSVGATAARLLDDWGPRSSRSVTSTERSTSPRDWTPEPSRHTTNSPKQSRARTRPRPWATTNCSNSTSTSWCRQRSETSSRWPLPTTGARTLSSRGERPNDEPCGRDLRPPRDSGRSRHPRCAGGVTVSSFEWLQDINRRAWSLDRVTDELANELIGAWRAVRDEYEARPVTWRDAADFVALSRIARAHEARGLWP